MDVLSNSTFYDQGEKGTCRLVILLEQVKSLIQKKYSFDCKYSFDFDKIFAYVLRELITDINCISIPVSMWEYEVYYRELKARVFFNRLPGETRKRVKGILYFSDSEKFNPQQCKNSIEYCKNKYYDYTYPEDKYDYNFDLKNPDSFTFGDDAVQLSLVTFKQTILGLSHDNLIKRFGAAGPSSPPEPLAPFMTPKERKNNLITINNGNLELFGLRYDPKKHAILPKTFTDYFNIPDYSNSTRDYEWHPAMLFLTKIQNIQIPLKEWLRRSGISVQNLSLDYRSFAIKSNYENNAKESFDIEINKTAHIIGNLMEYILYYAPFDVGVLCSEKVISSSIYDVIKTWEQNSVGCDLDYCASFRINYEFNSKTMDKSRIANSTPLTTEIKSFGELKEVIDQDIVIHYATTPYIAALLQFYAAASSVDAQNLIKTLTQPPLDFQKFDALEKVWETVFDTTRTYSSPDYIARPLCYTMDLDAYEQFFAIMDLWEGINSGSYVQQEVTIDLSADKYVIDWQKNPEYVLCKGVGSDVHGLVIYGYQEYSDGTAIIYIKNSWGENNIIGEKFRLKIKQQSIGMNLKFGFLSYIKVPEDNNTGEANADSIEIAYYSEYDDLCECCSSSSSSSGDTPSSSSSISSSISSYSSYT